MHKRILLVENSDTIRGAVEGLLRQNGYEVYSVPTAERGLQVASASRPDVMIVNSRAVIPDGTPLHQLIAAAPPAEAIPMLVISDQPSGGLGIPLEIEVVLPIDPVSIISKLSACLARSGEPVESSEAVRALGEVNASDDDLDHALGLDRIEVTDSEILDQTAVGRSAIRVVDASGVPFSEAENDRSGSVGSIMITEDQSEIRINQEGPKRAEPSESAELNILGEADQYNMDHPENVPTAGSNANHDYNWFVKEMQQDSESKPAAKPPVAPSPPPPSPSVPQTSISETPPTPRPQETRSAEALATPAVRQKPPAMPPAGDHTGAVAQFIDEFKKEVEKFQDQEPESIVIKEELPVAQPAPVSSRQWEETEETVTHQSSKPFSKEFTADLAQRIAELIVSKIDSEQLASLIKEAVRSSVSKNHK